MKKDYEKIRKKYKNQRKKEKEEIKKREGGTNQIVIDQWHDIDVKYDKLLSKLDTEELELQISYKIKIGISWIKKHKIISGSLGTIVAIITIVGFIISISQPSPETYFKNIKFERISDQNLEFFNITIGNKGSEKSENVIFEAKFSDSIEIDKSKISWSREPDNISYDKKYLPHFVRLTWDTIPATIYIDLSLYLNIFGVVQNGQLVYPLYIKVFADGEYNPIYDFQRDTFPGLIQ